MLCACGNYFAGVILSVGGKILDVGLILKIAGIGILVSVVSSILSKSGKDEQAMLVTVAGIIVVMLMLVEEMGVLLEMVRSIFEL